MSNITLTIKNKDSEAKILDSDILGYSVSNEGKHLTIKFENLANIENSLFTGEQLQKQIDYLGNPNIDYKFDLSITDNETHEVKNYQGCLIMEHNWDNSENAVALQISYDKSMA